MNLCRAEHTGDNRIAFVCQSTDRRITRFCPLFAFFQSRVLFGGPTTIIHCKTEPWRQLLLLVCEVYYQRHLSGSAYIIVLTASVYKTTNKERPTVRGRRRKRKSKLTKRNRNDLIIPAHIHHHNRTKNLFLFRFIIIYLSNIIQIQFATKS